MVSPFFMEHGKDSSIPNIAILIVRYRLMHLWNTVLMNLHVAATQNALLTQLCLQTSCQKISIILIAVHT